MIASTLYRPSLKWSGLRRSMNAIAQVTAKHDAAHLKVYFFKYVCCLVYFHKTVRDHVYFINSTLNIVCRWWNRHTYYSFLWITWYNHMSMKMEQWKIDIIKWVIPFLKYYVLYQVQTRTIDFMSFLSWNLSNKNYALKQTIVWPLACR